MWFWLLTSHAETPKMSVDVQLKLQQAFHPQQMQPTCVEGSGGMPAATATVTAKPLAGAVLTALTCTMQTAFEFASAAVACAVPLGSMQLLSASPAFVFGVPQA
jgi:hypothetical protein